MKKTMISVEVNLTLPKLRRIFVHVLKPLPGGGFDSYCGPPPDLRVSVADAIAAAKPPSSLAKQIADAQAEYDSWSPEKRASVRLEGSSDLRPKN